MNTISGDIINNLCVRELNQNTRYIELRNRSIILFDKIKNHLDEKKLIFEYEEIISEMNEITEITCFNVGRHI